MVKRDIRDYLTDILTYIDLAEKFIKDMTFAEFEEDQKTVLALTRAVEIVGEATKNIPSSIREQNPEVPWKDIAGMRDRIAHVYFGIDLDIVWSTAKERLPELRPVIQSILDDVHASDSST
jgi:uncharacterized protein with HEPN domain